MKLILVDTYKEALRLNRGILVAPYAEAACPGHTLYGKRFDEIECRLTKMDSHIMEWIETCVLTRFEPGYDAAAAMSLYKRVW